MSPTKVPISEANLTQGDRPFQNQVWMSSDIAYVFEDIQTHIQEYTIPNEGI